MGSSTIFCTVWSCTIHPKLLQTNISNLSPTLKPQPLLLHNHYPPNPPNKKTFPQRKNSQNISVLHLFLHLSQFFPWNSNCLAQFFFWLLLCFEDFHCNFQRFTIHLRTKRLDGAGGGHQNEFPPGAEQEKWIQFILKKSTHYIFNIYSKKTGL